MVRAKLKTPEGRKFLLALLVVFMIAAACVGRATIVCCSRSCHVHHAAEVHGYG